jgi:natural product precursor
MILKRNKMKKLSLKNLKVVKISDKEKASITGGYGGASSLAECGGDNNSEWPIQCASKNWACY